MQSNLTNAQIATMIPIVAIVSAIAGIGLPAIGFNVVRKVIAENESMAGIMLVCVTVVCVTGLLVGAAVILALIGWLPSPLEFLGS